MSRVLEQGLYALIKDNSPQTLAKKRVYPRLPQPVIFPAIRYQRITTDRVQSLDGSVGVAEATMQVDCMADSYSDAKQLSDEVRAILHGYSGAWSTLKARNVHLEDENDFFEQEGDKVTHWVTQRYRVWTDMD